MKDDFLKFPSTSHLLALDGVDVRDDKVLSPTQRQRLLSHSLVVEEKIDGANLGISFDRDGNLRLQNRGSYLHLPGHGQWKKLDEWILPRTDILIDVLSDRFVLFGEWCYARHSIFYDLLPDWFLGFDVYDKTMGNFVSTRRRNTMLSKSHLSAVPTIAHGKFTIESLRELLGQSKYSTQPAEGLYIRHESRDWLMDRAKMVRGTFVQSIEKHWSRSSIVPNRVVGVVHA